MEIQRESIFISAIRSLLKAIGVILGIFIAFIPIFLIISIFSSDVELPNNTKMTILPDANGKMDLQPHSAPVVLQIKIHGVIGAGDLTGEKISHQLIDSQRGMLEGRVKAILLHINTPGGGVNDSDIIYREIKAYKEKYKVPVYAYVEGLCASGGMYVASATDKIFSSPVSIIGSVGIFMGPFFNFSQLMEKYGIKSKILSAGKDKLVLNPWLPWKEGEDKGLQDITYFLYNNFIHIVSEARPKLTKEKLVQDYGAEVFAAPTAKEHGYIDEDNQDYKSTLIALLEAAHVEPNRPYQVVQLQPKSQFLKGLFNGSSALVTGKVKHKFDLGKNDLSEINDQFAYLYLPEESGF